MIFSRSPSVTNSNLIPRIGTFNFINKL
jgi:hypothetical protein